MPKRAAEGEQAPAQAKRRSKPPARFHEMAAEKQEQQRKKNPPPPQQQQQQQQQQEPESDSESDEPEGLARFTPAALDQPAKAVQKSLKASGAAKGARGETPGVIYLGHIPHGFYEAQMKGFFSQFGEVSKLRLSRNKKTGNSRHYAFIEFADRHVAAVVAETMDNYLLCNKLLVCKVVDAEKLHEKVWVGANKKFQTVPWRSIARNKHNAPRTAEQQSARQDNLVKKEAEKRAKLVELGIDYDFGGYAELLPQKKSEKKTTEKKTSKKKKKKKK